MLEPEGYLMQIRATLPAFSDVTHSHLLECAQEVDHGTT